MCELGMLSLDLASKNDRDQAKQKRRKVEESPPDNLESEDGSSDSQEMPLGVSDRQAMAEVTPVPGASSNKSLSEDSSSEEEEDRALQGSEKRASLLDRAGEGDIAGDVEGEEEVEETLPVPFKSPPPPKGKGKNSFEAIDPTNVLPPLEAVILTFQNVMVCPNEECSSRTDGNKQTLEVEHEQCGFATELHIR